MFGVKVPITTIFDTNVVNKIEELINMKITGEFIDQLETAGITEPYKIINIFGGNLQTLGKFICYNKPSIFLYLNKEITKRLFLLSRTLIKQEFDVTKMRVNTWMKNKKKKSYNQTFLQLK